jgi:hypothetical protein
VWSTNKKMTLKKYNTPVTGAARPLFWFAERQRAAAAAGAAQRGHALFIVQHVFSRLTLRKISACRHQFDMEVLQVQSFRQNCLHIGLLTRLCSSACRCRVDATNSQSNLTAAM